MRTQDVPLAALAAALQERYPDLEVNARIQHQDGTPPFRTISFNGPVDRLIAHGLAWRPKKVRSYDPSSLTYSDGFGTIGMGSDSGDHSTIHHHLSLDGDEIRPARKKFPTKGLEREVRKMLRRFSRGRAAQS